MAALHRWDRWRDMFACFKAKAENMCKAEDVHEDPAFVMRGFKNWKKAIKKFNLHEETQYHLHAV